ncbi:MAG TPA: hypothetical protein VHK00_01025, partial [Miltoncostaeaceae bacterium]|nr:hypothetical protein [Miltoncostaeaceae bacterium]
MPASRRGGGQVVDAGDPDVAGDRQPQVARRVEGAERQLVGEPRPGASPRPASPARRAAADPASRGGRRSRRP